MVAKWKSLIEHVCNKHDDLRDDLYKECQHEPMGEDYEWIKPGTVNSKK